MLLTIVIVLKDTYLHLLANFPTEDEDAAQVVHKIGLLWLDNAGLFTYGIAMRDTDEWTEDLPSR